MANLFNEFLEESKRIRLKYKIWIERHPDKKDSLLKEMNDTLAKLLDEFENKEKQSFYVKDKMKEYNIKQKVKFLPKK